MAKIRVKNRARTIYTLWGATNFGATTITANECAEIVWRGDGAAWQWDMADRIYLNAIQIQDWPHAIEHAVDCAKVVFDGDEISVGI